MNGHNTAPSTGADTSALSEAIAAQLAALGEGPGGPGLSPDEQAALVAGLIEGMGDELAARRNAREATTDTSTEAGRGVPARSGELLEVDESDEHQGEGDEDALGVDAESVEANADVVGGDVDPADGVPAEVAARAARVAKPIVPEWATSWQSVYLTARRALMDAAHTSAYHLTRSPKYLLKVTGYGIVGALRSVGRLIGWAWAEEGNWGLRQVAANRGDAEMWLRLDRQRQAQTVWRWWVASLVLLAGLVTAAVLVYGPVPNTWRAAVVAVIIAACARLGRPEGARITDRVVEGAAYRKLTAELVRRGLASLGLAGITSALAKDPNAIKFPTEIHRDGPGHLAVIDLPYGVLAADVVARRDRLASALRLPMDQVWPETNREHTGRLNLWVGYEPASAMRQPAWPYAKHPVRVDVFKPVQFGTDPRLRPVNFDLMFRNYLFGGQPGSGKTFALRLLPLYAALDPRCEIRIYELKGVGDFKALAPVCAEYGNGFDDDTIGACAAMLDWLYGQCQARAARIEYYAAKGQCPENKVTPELASLKGSGLHPLLVCIDEAQELFQHPKYGAKAGEMAEKVIKLGRAMGVILAIGTQIPDKDSLPTGITRNISSRFCLSVADQTANDMILGTSAYKQGHRATVFEPGIDAGWGIASGVGKTGAYRSHYVDTSTAAEVIAKAVQLRGGAIEADEAKRTVPTYDLLADLALVFPAGEDAAWNDTLATALAELRPEIYGGWEAANLTTALKPWPAISVRDIGRRIAGKPVTRRGIRRTDLQATITQRKHNTAPK